MGQATSNVMRKLASPIIGSRKPDENSSGECNKMAVTPFVFKRRGSLYRDEDGHMAHEFYEEIKDGNSNKSVMTRKYGNLTPQGDVELQIPRLHADFPVVLCEAVPR